MVSVDDAETNRKFAEVNGASASTTDDSPVTVNMVVDRSSTVQEAGGLGLWH